ncbi:Cytochrome c oxidase subunit 5B, mitochondrial [Exophiala xenobiotica]|nr:Cytochrome c oxidase subunit 5B, mitochondrial [Exophiala xenobiotica]KAK5233754.1 Cytochrome c oxidase subunit 5B, mitochondrial [Exophiala xenobiotica]KAK5270355.1 Cytochrome c oxidase subunit 5B, mitochondrial [Exophiala xenobiotica]KAK5379745.1 Cytochrome c oxidase subunit 5B, mitochondrial [Exophiala xenobiotica]KAK5382383.1 Cytochrome c oxidase subunit 5B, mitochondrial [Exophiala xenobiotica]
MFLHSLPRAARSSTSSLKTSTRMASASLRNFQSSARSMAPTFSATQQPPMTSQSHIRSAHAISNPTLAGIEKRWEAMPPQEQAELWMQLRDRMKVDWHEMTLQEKKAGMTTSNSYEGASPETTAWWIAFGPHGPRAETPPGEWTKVWIYTAAGVAISAVLFLIIHSFARPPPRTMTKEWQEATNEYLKSEKSNPIYGISSEGYSGKGHVQSKSAKAQGIKIEADE